MAGKQRAGKQRAGKRRAGKRRAASGIAASGIAVGYNKGHIVTRRKRKIFKKKKKEISTRKQLIKDVIREVSGFSPYEKRLIEMLKVGTAISASRSLRYAKKKLGSHKRAKTKRDELQQYIMLQKRKAAEKH